MIKPQNLPYEPKTLTVLIADGHALIRKSIRKVLVKNYFQNENILETSNAKEASEIFQKTVIDLVIGNLFKESTNFSGFDLLDFIRNSSTNSDLPFLVVTGEASKEEIVKAAELGANDYLVKPFQAEDLEKKVETLLRRYHSPSPLVAHLRTAERHIRSRNYPKAQVAVEMAIKIDPDSARAAHIKALLLDINGETKAAIALLQESIGKQNQFIPNYKLLSDLFYKTSRFAECITTMTEELEINPHHPARQVLLSQLLMKASKFNDAIAHFRQALLENGKLNIALFGMGQCYAHLNNLEKAIYYFKRLRRHHPKSTKALEAIVKYALQQGAPKQAEITLRNEKKAYPKRLDTYTVLAKFYAATDRIDQAIAIIDDVLKLEPEMIDSLRMKAALQYKAQDFKGAVVTYESILSINTDIMAYLNLAELLIHMQSYPQAFAYLHQALKLEQQQIRVTYWLSEANSKTNQYLKAYFLLKKLQGLSYRDPALAENLRSAVKAIMQRRQHTRQRAS